jgi:hypothetical protein
MTTCECGHSNKDHKILNFASGRIEKRCKGLGTERRPMKLGSNTWFTHFNCDCRIDMTPKVYQVMTHDSSINQTYVNKEFKTREEAEKHVDLLYAWCDEIWCEKHKNWIEEV